MTYLKNLSWPLLAAMTVGFTTPASAQTQETTPTTSFTDIIAEAEESKEILRKLILPATGMYTLRAPANSGVQLRINGEVLIDATGSRLAEVGEEITAFVSLDVGAHAITIAGITEENANIALITLNMAGQAPEPLFAQTTELDHLEAAEILTARAGLPASNGGGVDATPVLASGAAPFTPFAIGGGSSGGARAAAAAAVDKNAQMGSVNTGMQSSGMSGTTTASMTGATSTTDSSSGTTTTDTTSSGQLVSFPSTISSGSSSGSDGGVSTPTTPTTGTPTTGTPTTGTPTPTPNPISPTVAQVTPLTPPTVELTEVIQLTSAGNEEGLVPNTGTTLFGAVMDDSVFDQIAVTFDPPRDTETTVAVGTETGQFAVRMFPEDFSNASEVTVTLVGQLSTNAEVTSEPISYVVTGSPVEDGVGQALSRLTFGASPELYARVRAIGFENFVREQLDADNINDSTFNAMQPGELLNDSSNTNFLNSLMDYDLAHAAFSEKQLQEVMGRFWANHFHAITKGTQIVQQNLTDREFFRENALGNFEDMLLYSARSPLMSQYLDNDANRAGGLNENYAREVLELSTLGVDGGYTEEDIIEVARIFTGWNYNWVNEGSDDMRVYEFEFMPDRHDTGDKVLSAGFLNTTIVGREGDAGVQEGEELITMLAQHESTRNFVCGKLVQLLVADEPPAGLVAACAAAWEASGGEVVPMLEAILLDPSYITSVEYQRNKVKNPFEFAASFIRAFGATPVEGEEATFYSRFRSVYTDAGYIPLYSPAPTGLPEVGTAWVSSAKMVAAYERMNTIVERPDLYGIDLLEAALDAGLETPEEVAGYLLTVATGDRFTKLEFDKVVQVLNGNDSFEPLDPDGDESQAVRRALATIMATPSFLIQ
ncbi:uncharacterized protein DUF1800 [Yoonia maricola]|uniref:Uncharacterized protein DUF1800 n=1 Tax=Yoonia maricola TaxID=420999 RepID=A0A2M8W1X7_9RHOB|nr:DUF1800 domain-containing protein [Yoonia maricola]PJI84920.1 uncharacterized protein DUF1800 [Yoonia maricola]